jgi:phage/conjugal plasmid C-4 type zinc finger TraR family protein
MSENSPAADDDVFVLQQNEINEALDKARKALYIPTDDVECIDCGEEIPPARKILIPSAVRCVACAQRAERRV